MSSFIQLLLKSCQVRRGILLLEPSNVKVLGGQVPSLYGHNMLAELEKRFKKQLRSASIQLETYERS